MNEALFELGRKRPDSVLWFVQELSVWFYGTVYDWVEGEVGGTGVMRFLRKSHERHRAGAITDMLFTAAEYFNLTLESVDVDDYLDNNSSQAAAIAKSFQNGTDITEIRTLFWKPLADELETSEFMFTKPIWEIHEIGAFIPKTSVRKDFFNFLSVFSKEVWFVLLVTHVVVAFMHQAPFNDGIFNLAIFSNAVFRYLKLTFGNLNIKKQTLLTFLWLLGICFFLLQSFLSHLHTRLTFEKMVYPDTFLELYDSRDNYHFVTDIPISILSLSIEEGVAGLGEIAEYFTTDQALEILQRFSQENTAIIARQVDIAALIDLFDKERYARLNEEYFSSQTVFMVSKKFRFHKEFVKLIERFKEGGVYRYNEIVGHLIRLALRLTRPKVLRKFSSNELWHQISFDDTKGVFVLWVFGSFLAFLAFFSALTNQYFKTN